MSGFLGSNHKTTVTKYSGLQVQSTSSALPVPIGYGLNTIAPNCIWYSDFVAHPNSNKSGGKGGGGGKATSYNYTCAIIMALGEGPITQIGDVWDASPTATDLAHTGLAMFDGSMSQTTWSYLTSRHADQALAYPGTAYLCSGNYSLGSSASVSSNTFEVYWPLAGTGYNSVDADPALVVQDFLTNSRYGAGFPASSIDAGSLLGGTGTSSYQAYCWASGLAISPVLSSQEKASAVLERWLQLTNSTVVWSGGLLKFFPFGDLDVIGNGQTWVSPNNTPLYDFDDDDFVHSEGEDPVIVNRSDPLSAYNRLILEIKSRDDSYGTGPVEVFDQALIDRFGSRPGQSIAAHEFCDIDTARHAAQLILQRKLYIRNTYTFKLSHEFCLLDPMDLVTVTDVALGLDKTVVRITEIAEDDAGILTVTAEEYPPGVANATRYPAPHKTSNAPNNLVAPGPVNAPVIFEPPGQLAGALQLWIAASGQSPSTWGGCNVWASFDGSSYSQVGRITGGSRQGTTTASLATVSTSPSGPTVDATHTLAVSTAMSNGTLLSTSQAGAEQGATLCYVGGELMAFRDAVLTGSSAYNLSYLVRGLYGTQATVGAHASGSQFAMLDETVFKYTYTNNNIGKTIYIKLTSFNIFGAAEQSLADVAVYTHVLSGSPTPSVVTVLTATLTQPAGTVSLTLDATWTPDPLAISYLAEISADGGSTWRTVYSAPQTSLTQTGLGPQNILLRITGVSANTVPGPSTVISVTSPAAIDYSRYTVQYVTYDQLSASLIDTLHLGQMEALDDLAAVVALSGEDLRQQIVDVRSQVGAAQASVTQTMSALTGAAQALADYKVEVQAAFDGSSALITQEAQARSTSVSAVASDVRTLEAEIYPNGTGSQSAIANITDELQAKVGPSGSLTTAVQTLNSAVYPDGTGNPSSIATVSNELQAKVGPEGSVTSSLAAVSARTDAGTASGKIRFVAVSSPGTGVAAAYDIEVSATGVAGTYKAAGLRLEVDASTGLSRIVMTSDSLYIANSATKTVVFGANADGTLTLNGVTNVASTIKSTAMAGGNPVMSLDFVNGIIDIYDNT